jgi:hypothetical protein
MNSKTILQQTTMFYTCNNNFIISTKVFCCTRTFGGGGGFFTILKLKNINLTHMFCGKIPNLPHSREKLISISLDFCNRFQ